MTESVWKYVWLVKLVLFLCAEPYFSGFNLLPSLQHIKLASFTLIADSPLLNLEVALKKKKKKRHKKGEKSWLILFICPLFCLYYLWIYVNHKFYSCSVPRQGISSTRRLPPYLSHEFIVAWNYSYFHFSFLFDKFWKKLCSSNILEKKVCKRQTFLYGWNVLKVSAFQVEDDWLFISESVSRHFVSPIILIFPEKCLKLLCYCGLYIWNYYYSYMSQWSVL